MVFRRTKHGSIFFLALVCNILTLHNFEAQLFIIGSRFDSVILIEKTWTKSSSGEKGLISSYTSIL